MCISFSVVDGVAAAAGVVAADLVITAPVDVVVTIAAGGNLLYFRVIDAVLALDVVKVIFVLYTFSLLLLLLLMLLILVL